MEKVPTPGVRTIEDVSRALSVPAERCLKTLVVKSTDGLLAFVLRGDHELNRVKAEAVHGVARPLAFADQAAIRAATGCGTGSLGPAGLKIPVVADHAALAVGDFVCGANEDGFHLRGVNWQRDVPVTGTADLRNVTEGEAAPDGAGALHIARGIEVGHIFQLGTKYSQAMKANCLNEKGEAVTLIMGCYGIGVSRIVAAAIEQNHDERGIIWGEALAPFELALVPIQMHKSQRLREAVEKLYGDLRAAGVDVLLDDRKERPGVMFTDLELIGIPHRLVFGERGLDNGTLEYRGRRDEQSIDIPLADAIPFVRKKLGR